jgi:glycosyltransferase involved in cell wall biosynthesis
MGDGPLDKEIQRFAAQYPNIYLQPAVDPSVVLEYTASASVGIAYIDNPSMNDRLCLPNKFFEYIMAGLPVIVNDAPEVKAIVEQHKIGIVLSELSAASLGQGLDRISQMDHQQLTANLHNAAAEFCWERQAVTMLDAYKTHVLNGRATTS